MTKSREIQEHEECKESMKEHWSFLENLIHTIVFESPNIEMTDEQVEGFKEELRNIRYGFEMAWPHAWKHGVQQFWNRFDKGGMNKDD